MFGNRQPAPLVSRELYETYVDADLALVPLTDAEHLELLQVASWYAHSQLALGETPPPDPLRAALACAGILVRAIQAPKVRAAMESEAKRVRKAAAAGR